MSMNVQPVILSGKIVRLEPLSFEHAPGLAAIGCDPEIWRYMLYGVMQNETDIRRWITDLLNRQTSEGDLPFSVFHLLSGRIAGATRYLNIEPDNRSLEIGGTWYGKEFQRTGVNTETKYLLLQHAFETLGCVRVQLKTDSRNIVSQRAIERIGAKKEGVLRHHMITPEGTLRDSVFYSILDTEWPEVKERLEKMKEKY